MRDSDGETHKRTLAPILLLKQANDVVDLVAESAIRAVIDRQRKQRSDDEVGQSVADIKDISIGGVQCTDERKVVDLEGRRPEQQRKGQHER